MKILLASYLILIWASNLSAYSVRDVSPVTQVYGGGRIVGGRDADPHEFPYIVSLNWNADDGGIWHNCGGSILNERWILTAAHCVDFGGGFYEIRAGAHYLNETMYGEQTSLVAQTIIHPDYDSEYWPNDIALLELASPFTFSGTVQPIALPPQDVIPLVAPSIISGWGSTSDTQTPIWPNTLQTVVVPLITNAQCQEAIADTGAVIYPQEICTGPLEGGMGTCNGDSGGPLVQNDIVVGVVAWGWFPCAASNSPTAYGRVYLSRGRCVSASGCLFGVKGSIPGRIGLTGSFFNWSRCY